MTNTLGRRLMGAAALLVALACDALGQGSPPANRLSDCRQIPKCAAILEAPPPALLAALSDADQVREAAFRTEIAISDLPQLARGMPTLPGYHLAMEPGYTPASEAIVKAVRARVPKAEADHARNTTGTNGLTPDQERFDLVSIRSVTIEGDHATVRFAKFESSSTVTLDRTPSGWRPVAVRVTTTP